MKRMASRLGVRAGIGTAVAAFILAIPGIASAGVNQGTFFTGPGLDGQMATTILYQSTSTASTCVDTTTLTGAWHFILIWRNGGANTHLFASRSFTAPGLHCSPTEHIPGSAPKVFDEIFATGVFSHAEGDYSITTN